ncbi:MAG: glycosyl hydrolase [Fibrobacter sp.]|nr:glycosyl hydrolase [Fibrobacter sp.]
MRRKTITTALVAASIASAANITVDPTATAQKIVGFGAGAAYYQSWITAMSSSMQKDFYDTAFTGLNLSLLRIGNWKQEDTTSIAADVAIVKAGKQRRGNNLKIEMSSWSAPGRLKPSGSVNGNQGHSKSDKTLKTSSSDPYGKFVYSEFAHWWKTSLQAYEQMGITPDYISLQNEPDMEADYEETLFDPTEGEIAGYKQALQAVRDSISTLANPPKIIGPEPLGIGYSNFEKYAKALDDQNLDGYAYHLYHAGDGNDNSGTNYLNPENFRKAMTNIGKNYGSDSKPIIMTEFCTMENAVREQDMLGLAHIMQVGFTSGKLNAYIAWELFWGEQNGQLIGVCPGNGWSSCTEEKLYINPEYHAMRHYSKFVNPGWRVVSSTADGSDVYAVAFRSADCDSITVVAINKGSAQNLNLSVNGYNPVSAVQSSEGGSKSREITAGAIIDAPAKSITTVVFTTSNTAALQCEDSPIVDPYVDPNSQIGDSLVIVDYASENSATGWKSDETLGAVTYENNSVKVPLANCAQDECGYQHALFTIPDAAAVKEPLTKCKELVFTMKSIDTEDASVNIGGAGGSTWINYQYGNTAPASGWEQVSVPLANEIDSTGTPYGSTQLSFNSDNAGIYIAKIVATGCGGTSPIKGIRTNFAASDMNADAKVFDLNGNLLWTGIKGQALNANGTLRLDLRKGMYIVKTGSSTVKAVK